MRFGPGTRPTLFFIGVTTGQSSIMKVFPAWAEALGLKDAAVAGIDFPLHAAPAAYREAVAFIRDDPLSLGALITTHKIDLFRACHDLFDKTDPQARLLGETSCLAKRRGRLIAHAKDPITAGLAIDAILGPCHFARTGAELFCIGAGGAGIALTWHLMRRSRGPEVPARIVVSDLSRERLDEIARVHGAIETDVPIEYREAISLADNDAVLERLKPGSVVVNATGLGKDRPGSPLTDTARFPDQAVAWDLNYRGNLVFLDQARRQQVRAEDGCDLFPARLAGSDRGGLSGRHPDRRAAIRHPVRDRPKGCRKVSLSRARA